MMTAKEMWELFAAREGVTAECEAWAFGGAPDKLADLTLKGIKTATASALIWYETGEEPMPREGSYSVILNSGEEAVCVIRTTRVYVVPFDQVSPEHAWKEGEGDRSLEYWRRVHEEFFSGELKEIGQPFREDMGVVCEEFELVFQP